MLPVICCLSNVDIQPPVKALDLAQLCRCRSRLALITSLICWVSTLLHRRRLILWLPLWRQLLLVLLLGHGAASRHLVLLWLPLWW